MPTPPVPPPPTTPGPGTPTHPRAVDSGDPWPELPNPKEQQ